MKRILYIILIAIFSISLFCGCSPKGDSTGENTSGDNSQKEEIFNAMDDEVFIKGDDEVSEIAGEKLKHTDRIKWLGRHYYENLAEGMFFSQSASGFEVRFFGTQIEAEVTRINAVYKGNYLAVSIDGEYNPESFKTVELTSTTQTVVLAEGLTEGNHVVRVYKKDESICGKLYLQKVKTDGYFYKKPTAKKLKIEVFGDSITCGYGVDSLCAVGEEFDAATEDACDTYAFLTSQMLNAELSVLATSGWGMKRGLGPNSAIPEWFERVDIQSQTEWDVSYGKADIVIIALGANDNTYINQASSASEKEGRIEDFRVAYKAFLDKLLSVYPNVNIICTYGFLNENVVIEVIEEIVAEYQAKSSQVHGVKVKGANSFIPIALHGHPGKGAHKAAAEKIVGYLEQNNIASRACTL